MKAILYDSLVEARAVSHQYYPKPETWDADTDTYYQWRIWAYGNQFAMLVKDDELDMLSPEDFLQVQDIEIDVSVDL